MAGRFSIEAVFKATDGISKIVGQIEGRVGKFSRGLGDNLNAMNKINGKLISGFADVAKQAAVVGAVVGGITLGGLSQIVHTGADFEQAITNVGAVSGHTRAQIGDLEKAAMSLGVSTQFSSTEVANGMEMMARKGFSTQEILKGIPGVLDAVAASGQGMEEVATVVGSAIRGFGLDAGDAGRVANILAFVSSRTGATITDLGSAMATAAPTAKALGVSIEDTATAVGLLQKVGIDASTSGTAVATMLAKLSKPSHEAAQEMARLGMKVQDAKGNMLPFKDVLNQFVQAGDKAGGNMKRMAFFAELVGLRGDKAALGLSDMAKSGDFAKLADDIQHVGDYAHRVAEIRMDTTHGAWKLLTSTVDVLETKLFNLQSGTLRGVIKRTNEWFTANQDLIATKIDVFIKRIGDSLPTVVTWAERFGKAAGVFLAFAGGVKAATWAMALFNFVADANPWVLLAFAITGVTAAVVAFWPEIKKHWEIVGAVAFVTGLAVFALKGQAMWTGIVNGVTLIATKGMKLYAFATDAAATASGAASAGFMPLLLTLGAIALAVVAVYGAFKSLSLLLDTTGGWKGLVSGANSFFMNGSFFQGVDAYQNAQAKAGNPDAKAAADAAAPPDPMAWFKSMMMPPGMPGAPATPGGQSTMPALPGMPAIPGMPQDPQAMIAAIMAQQAAAPPGGPQAAQASAMSSKEQGEALAAAMAPVLTEALKKGKGEITITDKTGRAEVTKQPSSGFNLNMAASGAF